MQEQEQEQEISNRLRWQCRRGMLELDLMLQGFLDTRYAALELAEQEQFREILNQSDQLLFDWLMNKSIPMDKEIHHVIKKIRACPDH